MDYGIASRTALVVGGSKGIGFEVAKMLAAEGCRVAIVARTQRHIDAAVSTIAGTGAEAVGILFGSEPFAELRRGGILLIAEELFEVGLLAGEVLRVRVT